jgi:predicted permease
MSQHLEDRYRELEAGGVNEEEAFRTALSELDDMYPMQAEYRDADRLPKHDVVPPGKLPTGSFAEDLRADLRYAGRMMRKNPLFVLFVVMTLALGVGANATVFTVINTLILNPLPVKDSSSLAALAGSETKATSRSNVALPISYEDVKDYQTKNEVFSSLAAYTAPRPVTLQEGNASQRMFSELVTGNYFSTLGLSPAAGRFFLPEEDSTPGAHPVAVLNYATWKARFGGSSDMIGKTLKLNNIEFTIVGVAPPRFIGTNAIFGPDVWIPAAMAEELMPNEMQGALSDRKKGLFEGIGRLKPGLSRSQAEANIAAIASDLARQYPDVHEGYTVTVLPISDVIYGSSASGPAPIVFASVVLLVVAGLVLLIACSNVANLLLARSAARQQELAVRLAMGASRGRLLRQLLTESVCLGLAGGMAGLAFGYAGLRMLWFTLPAQVSANLIAPKLDGTVLAFALLLSLATGFVFGIVPALRASSTGIEEGLKEGTRTAGKNRAKVHFANALLAGQVALSFLLLVTAALFLRSMQHAYDMNPGFQTKHLAVFLSYPGQAGYREPQTKAFYKEVRERVAVMPGVDSVSWASNLPLWGRIVSGLQIEGRHARSKADKVTTIMNTVDVHYFETAGVAIDRGRAFTNMDRADTAPVAIINEKMAHDYWPKGDVIGKRLQLPGEQTMREIVGIARTANYSTLGELPQPCVYVPLEQNYSDAMTLYVRSKGDPQSILLPVQREIRSLAPHILVNDIRTGQKIIDDGLFQAKMGVALLSIFGLLALGLASVGLYGLMAYSVNQRTREIGVRMALGAARNRVLGLIVRQGMSLVIAGVLIGAVAALVIDRLLSKLLYGVGANDPISLLSAAFVMATAAAIACYLPARRASRIDPLAALRQG